MQFAMEELVQSFEHETSIQCEIILSSSGKLTAQIKEGAPYDIFLSADLKFPTELYNAGLTTATPRIYAYGHLVLWSMVEGLMPSIELLETKKVNRIAISNPKTAPYGKASMQVIVYYDLSNAIEDKLVYGESIAQTNQFITSKSAEIGITAKSVVLSPAMRDKGKWVEIDTSAYSAIPQSMVMLKNENDHIEKAERFGEFLLSDKGKEILERYGYSIK